MSPSHDNAPFLFCLRTFPHLRDGGDDYRVDSDRVCLKYIESTECLELVDQTKSPKNGLLQ